MGYNITNLIRSMYMHSDKEIEKEAKSLGFTFGNYEKMLLNQWRRYQYHKKNILPTNDTIKQKKLSDIFDKVKVNHDGYFFVQYGDKWNVLTPEKEIIYDTWFDNIKTRRDSATENPYGVFLNGQLNYILPQKHKIISDVWFEAGNPFDGGWAEVRVKGVRELLWLNTDGEIFYDDGTPYQPTTPEPINDDTTTNESKSMNRKNTIRLTESELKKVITESVKNILSEAADFSTYPFGAHDSAVNDWWKQQVNNDFPDYQDTSSDWHDTYTTLDIARDKENKEVGSIVNKGWCTYQNIKEVLTGSDDDHDDSDGLMALPIGILVDTGKPGIEIRGGRTRSNSRLQKRTFNPDSFNKPLKSNKSLRNATFSVGYGGSIEGSDEYMQLTLNVAVGKTKINVQVVSDNPHIDTSYTEYAIKNAICNEAKRRYEEKIRAQRTR